MKKKYVTVQLELLEFTSGEVLMQSIGAGPLIGDGNNSVTDNNPNDLAN